MADGTFVYISGCYAPIVDASSPYVLDPCNCSSYYQRIQHPTPGRERKLCPTDQLWNYKVNQCRSSESVVDGRLCERGSPWSRCINITANAEIKVREDCIKKQYYFPDEGSKFTDHFYKPLPQEVQNANVELALMSMLAGSIITLMAVAICVVFCRGLPANSCLGAVWPKIFSGNFGKKPSSKGKLKRGVTTEVSAKYEDIDDDEMENFVNDPVKSPDRNLTRPVPPRSQPQSASRLPTTYPPTLAFELAPSPNKSDVAGIKSPVKPVVPSAPKPNLNKKGEGVKRPIVPPKKLEPKESFGYLRPSF